MFIDNVRLSLFLLLVSALLISSCGQPSDAADNIEGMNGTITISGAWALYPMMVRWAEEFQVQNPQVKFDISAGGAGKGMADALANAVDIGMVSREVYPEEIAKGAFWVSVAKDAVFATISEKNPVWEDLHQKGLDQSTLTAIFITGEMTTWGEVVDRPDGKKQEDLLGIGIYGDPGLLDAVIKDPLSIGYNNLNYAYDQDTGRTVAGAHVVPLDVNGNGMADPDEIYDTKDKAVEAVATSLYPSPPARDLNLVTRGQPIGLEHDFIVWILTEGQQYLSEAGYIALPQDRINSEIDKLD